MSRSGSSGIASSISGGALDAVADRLIHQRLNGNPTGFQNELGRFLESVSKIEKNRTSKRNFPSYLGGRGVSKVARSWWRKKFFLKFFWENQKKSNQINDCSPHLTGVLINTLNT